MRKPIQQECPRCHFKWMPRVRNPVECPECKCRVKRWREIDRKYEEKQKEELKKMQDDEKIDDTEDTETEPEQDDE